ncbi:MAG: GNAT family N-acetyltransferase [Bacteroidota bacterium]
MPAKEEHKINLTTDLHKITVCAKMMSESDPWITLGLDYNQCLKAFEGICKEIYVVEDGKEITGFVILQICGTFKGYIQTICIREGSRGEGLGGKLLMFCEERILKISPNIFICVSSFNKGAIRLYDELGYKQVGELENFVKQGFTELLLRKTVGPMEGESN